VSAPIGKGLVQQTRDLYYNSKLKVTVAKYYIPSGRCIQKLGLCATRQRWQVQEVKEEAIAEFKTRNGRPVFDGRGILPDMAVQDPELAKVVGGLYSKDLFFDFATKYRKEHAELEDPASFRISDALYGEFVGYVNTHEFHYDTESMKKLDELIETAKKERYYEHTQPQIEALRKELSPDRSEELVRFRTDIEEVLKNEIVSRYHFQTGRAKASLSTDPYILKGLEILNNGSYGTILAGK
jgi:carboxyl-terminal processing protease